MVEIRPYDESDEAAVAALWRSVFPNAPPWNHPETDIRRKLAVQRDLFLVAVQGQDVIGTVMGGYDGHRGWVYYLAVAKACRGTGAGRALMREVERRLIEKGCHKLNLQVRANNQLVIAFYEKIGYQVESHVSMGKRLKPEA